MGWPPAVVIVVRHGARLDAADKQWHITSPTPYDPPLTYGGWTQSRALGSRIASILRSRETDDDLVGEDEVPAKDDGKDRRKRRHKIVIHTSPFLRCVQSAIAISSGLASKPGHSTPSSNSLAGKPGQAHSSPRILPKSATDSPKLAAVRNDTNGSSRQKSEIKKSIVRVDAFLGEWLTPDYFEQITPPPSSIMMVAGAKADLLRREDYSNLIQTRQGTNVNVGFPGGWQSPISSPQFDKDEPQLPSMSSIGQALPTRERTSSLSSVGSQASRFSSARPSLAVVTDQSIYQPPVPHYALLHSDPIPAGYVAHARDACVDVDYQWDSMRDPQNWGTGGEYGEEWSSMHKRFRNGLQSMIHWYSTAEDPAKLVTRTPISANSNPPDEDGDEDTDLVLILVTHGAGCNALIGALTNQPVLLDVGMSSLTMAVRKADTKVKGSSPVHSRPSSRTFSLPDEYEVKLVANTEHLRTSSSHSTPTPSRTPSIGGNSLFKERFAPVGGLDVTSFSKTTRSLSSSGAFGSIRRPLNLQNSIPRSYIPAKQPSFGLWSASKPEEQEEDEEAIDDMILNFGDESPTKSESAENTKNASPATGAESDTSDRDRVPPLGLWASPKLSPRLGGEGEIAREISHKRRWTINESS
ncbi:hypothetical protein F5884DRAFT_796759 [Xylogone sp. PMI_703]|nr:hypothetical protein F5884DRAFT_796759 [Xylogone sp. PMI_703]